LKKLIKESNLHVLDKNLISALSDEEFNDWMAHVSKILISSHWYADIVYVLQNLNPLVAISKRRGRSFKLNASKCCILDSVLYWKDSGGVLLNCQLKVKQRKRRVTSTRVIVVVIYTRRPQ